MKHPVDKRQDAIHEEHLCPILQIALFAVGNMHHIHGVCLVDLIVALIQLADFQVVLLFPFLQGLEKALHALTFVATAAHGIEPQ